MIQQNKAQQATPAADPAATGNNDHYHGDLRKGAYLKRRAAYQMQAASATPRQPGTPTSKTRNPG